MCAQVSCKNGQHSNRNMFMFVTCSTRFVLHTTSCSTESDSEAERFFLMTYSDLLLNYFLDFRASKLGAQATQLNGFCCVCLRSQTWFRVWRGCFILKVDQLFCAVPVSGSLCSFMWLLSKIYNSAERGEPLVGRLRQCLQWPQSDLVSVPQPKCGEARWSCSGGHFPRLPGHAILWRMQERDSFSTPSTSPFPAITAWSQCHSNTLVDCFIALFFSKCGDETKQWNYRDSKFVFFFKERRIW